MAKRFTDTDKWKRAWFDELDPKGKLVWFYLLDQCDHRGVWFSNFRLLSMQVGFKVSGEDLDSWFGDKIRLFDGDKYFIESFVKFQYPTLNPQNNAHKSVIELIEALNNLPPNEDQRSPSQGAQDKVTYTDKVKETVLRAPKFKVSDSELESIYLEYPRKENKERGFKTLHRDIKNPEDLEKFRSAVYRYRDFCIAEGKELKFIKVFSTFVSGWREWLDPNTGTGIDTKPKSGLEQWRARVAQEEGA